MKKLILCLTVALTFVFFGLAFSGCDGCGGKTDNAEDCKHVHVSENVIEATCSLDGQKTVACTDCGYVFPVEKLPALGHDLGEAEVTPADCLLSERRVWQCGRCGEYVEEIVGEPLGHDYKEISTIPATCTEPETVNKECSRCGIGKTEPKENGQAALGHNYERVTSRDIAATCTTAGEEYYECTRCKDGYSDVIAPKGHTPDGDGEVFEPTCVLKGYILKHCTVCDENYKENFVEALGHDLEDGYTVAATCDRMGYDTKVCSRCDYEEKCNVTQNKAHEFDASGVCTSCRKKATDSFALTCEGSELFAITQDGNIYTVYAPSYKWWNKLVMPAEVVQALYEQGVYSFNIKLGSNADPEIKAMSIQVQGGTAVNLNVSLNEMKEIETYVFADEDGVFASAEDGIMFEVYYRVMAELDELVGKPRATCFAICFEYEIPFKAGDESTYFKTTLPYSYDGASGIYTFTDVKNNEFNMISLRGELLEYYSDLGYKALDITVGTAAGQHYGKNIVASSNGEVIVASGNINDMAVTLKGIELQSLLGYDLDLACYCTDHYGTGWDPEDPFDRILVTLTFVNDVYAYEETSGTPIRYTSVAEGNTVTYTFESVPNATFNRFCFNGSFIAEKMAAGYTGVSFVIDTWGSKAATLYENDTVKGSVTTNGSDPFDCGVIPLTEDASYYIRLYHNLPTGNAKPSDITVVVQFVKDVYAYRESGSVEIGYTAVTGTTATENDTVTYTFEAVENATFNRFCFNESFFAEKIAAGYTDVRFVIDTWGNKEADLYENENLIGHVLTNGSDAFDCGVVPLTENAYYYIRLYHNLPTGDAKPSDITVIVQFLKPVYAYKESDNSAIGYTAVTGTTLSENDTVTYTFESVENGTFNRFCFNESFFAEKIAEGYTQVSFVIDTWGNKEAWLYENENLIGHVLTNGSDAFDCGVIPLTANADYNIRLYHNLPTGDAKPSDITVIVQFIKPEIPWNDSIKLKIATTTGDFGGSSGNLADDKAKLDKLHAAGFKYVDLSMYSFTAGCDYMQADWADKIAELKDYADSLGMTFVQAHSQGGNALDEGQYDALVAYTLRQIEICGQLGIENIVVHPGFKSGYTKQQWFDGNKVFFDALLVKAAECGVNVLCENSTSKNLGSIYWANSGSDMREFIEYVNDPYFHACWDTGHGNCEGPQYDDILALGDELYAIHFNDNMGNGDFHLIPYYGTLDCDIVIRALNNIGYTGYFTFECDGGNRTNGSWHGPNDLSALSGNDPSDLTREQQERLLYEIGEYLLTSYGMFAE